MGMDEVRRGREDRNTCDTDVDVGTVGKAVYWRSSVRESAVVVCFYKNREKDGQRRGTNLVMFPHLHL